MIYIYIWQSTPGVIYSVNGTADIYIYMLTIGIVSQIRTTLSDMVYFIFCMKNNVFAMLRYTTLRDG